MSKPLLTSNIPDLKSEYKCNPLKELCSIHSITEALSLAESAESNRVYI